MGKSKSLNVLIDCLVNGSPPFYRTNPAVKKNLQSTPESLLATNCWTKSLWTLGTKLLLQWGLPLNQEAAMKSPLWKRRYSKFSLKVSDKRTAAELDRLLPETVTTVSAHTCQVSIRVMAYKATRVVFLTFTWKFFSTILSFGVL